MGNDRVRFEFGRNWARFLETVTEDSVTTMARSIAQFMSPDSVKGKSFLDIGCGSGLASLAAYRLGAKSVVSIDLDERCIDCCKKLKERFGVPESFEWTIYRASILDDEYRKIIPQADIVYAWGVLHHTGAMWRAIESAASLVSPDGYLYLAIYGRTRFCNAWRKIKRFYVRSPAVVQHVMTLSYAVMMLALQVALLRNPRRYVKNYRSSRGMSWYRDIVDWIGGYPYESASPEEVFRHLKERGFELIDLCTPCQWPPIEMGNNEFLFRRAACTSCP